MTTTIHRPATAQARHDDQVRSGEWEAIIASPNDPRTKYVPARLAHVGACRCPRTVIDAGPRSWQLKLWHAEDCWRLNGVERPVEALLTDAAQTYSLPRALALLADHRCPCLGCGGSLGASDYPSWQSCGDCRCLHQAGEIHGRMYHETVIGRCRRQVEER